MGRQCHKGGRWWDSIQETGVKLNPWAVGVGKKRSLPISSWSCGPDRWKVHAVSLWAVWFQGAQSSLEPRLWGVSVSMARANPLRHMLLLSAHGVYCFLSNYFRNLWFHLLPRQGVSFHYLKVVVFMNGDKHLVGRSFSSWSFWFEFHYFSCLPGEGKNTLSKHSFPFSGFPDRCTIRYQHVCSWLHLPRIPMTGGSGGDHGAPRAGGGGEESFLSVWEGAIQSLVPTAFSLPLPLGWERRW